MSTKAFREAWAEAKGDKEAYLKAVAEFPSKNYALIFWAQFNREIEVRQCICKNGGEVVNFLKHLPLSHMDFTVQTTYSDEVDSGLVIVSSDPNTKTITIVGAADDV